MSDIVQKLRGKITTPYDHIDRLRLKAADEIEQLRVQLAGCSLAALDCGPESSHAKEGDYGWSVAYQDILNAVSDYKARIEELEDAIDDAMLGG